MNKICILISLLLTLSLVGRSQSSSEKLLRGTWEHPEVRIEVKATTKELKDELEKIIQGVMLDVGLGEVLIFQRGGQMASISSKKSREITKLSYTQQGDSVMVYWSDEDGDVSDLEMRGDELFSTSDMTQIIKPELLPAKSKGKVEQILVSTVWKKTDNNYLDWLIEDLKEHPIVGIWYFDDFDLTFNSDNKMLNSLFNMSFSAAIEEEMNNIAGSYLIFTDKGKQIMVEYKPDLTEFVVKESSVKDYCIVGATLGELRGDIVEDIFEYAIADDHLYLIMDKMESREMLEEVLQEMSIEGGDSTDFTLGIKVKLKKSESKLTDLSNHAITRAAWTCERVEYVLDTDSEDEEQKAEMLENMEYFFAHQIEFWYNAFHFSENGVVSVQSISGGEDDSVTQSLDYFILNDKEINVLTPQGDIYTAGFYIDGDELILILSDEANDREMWGLLEGVDTPLEVKSVEMTFTLKK